MPNHLKRIGVSLWDLNDKLRDFEMVKGDLTFDRPTKLRFSPDGKTLWMASTDNLHAWDIGSGKLTWQWREGDLGRDSSLPFDSTISEDCRFYFRNDSDVYTVWNVKTNKRLVRTKLPFLYDAGLEFSSDGAFATYYGDAFTVHEDIVYPVIETRSGRMLWKSPRAFPLTFSSNKAIRRNNDNFEVLDARSGKLLGRLPAIPKTYAISSASKRWLYTTNDNRELFRQRLQ